MKKTIATTSVLVLWIFVPSVFAQLEAPPGVQWATYIGGVDHDVAFGVGADADGNVYVGGLTRSIDALARSDFLDELDLAGDWDALVLKLTPDGSEVLAAATFGGPDAGGIEGIFGLEVADDGSVVVLGQLRPGAQVPEETCWVGPGGGLDVFVARLDSELELQSFVLFGGRGNEDSVDLDVSADGVVSVLGNTTSDDLTTTPGALHQDDLGGETDYFVARLRLDPDVACADRAVYVTYLGSTGSEDSSGTTTNSGIHATDDGIVTIAGTTRSRGDFSMHPGGYRSRFLGSYDVVVQRILCDAARPRAEQDLYGAIIGGSGDDRPKWVGVTDEGIVQVVGWTWSGDFPSTDGSRLLGDNDIFVLELDPNLALDPDKQLRVATRFGGNRHDPPGEAVSRPDGSLIIGGITLSGNFPASCDALEGFDGVTNRAFLVEWRRDPENPGAGTVGLSTALSMGAGCEFTFCDRVQKLAWAPDGTLLACGNLSGTFPFDPGDVAQPFPGGSSDMFVMRLRARTPWADCPVFLRSDTNDDDAADLSDAVFTLNWLFIGGPAPSCIAAANSNGDGTVDLSDPVSLLSHLFLGGPAQVAPFPDCGTSALEADETLGCVESSCP